MGGAGPESIDGALLRLDEPLSTQDRLGIVDSLVAHWHGPCEPGCGIRADELGNRSFPYPLRYWYQRYGQRQKTLCRQNHLLAPDELQIEEDRAVFYVENQGVYLWSTALEGDDPPVWGRFNDQESWTREEGSLSSFLIQIVLFEAIMVAPNGASLGWGNERILERLVNAMPQLPLGDWQWPYSPSRFYGRGGAFMFAAPNGQYRGESGYSIWIGAKSALPLQFLHGVADDTWESRDF
jgi:hypothetical protein